MGLFGISRELQFRFCKHDEPRTSSRMAREGERFYRGENEVGRALVNRVYGFSLAQSLPGKKSLSSSCAALLSSQGVRAPASGLPTLFH